MGPRSTSTAWIWARRVWNSFNVMPILSHGYRFQATKQCRARYYFLMLLRIGRGASRQAVALAPPAGLQVDALQEHAELPGGDLPPAGLVERILERPGLQPLVPDRPPVPIPVQDLQPVRPPVAVDEQVAAEGVTLHDVLGQQAEAIEGAAHIAGDRAEVHLDRRRKTQHRGGSSTASTVRSVAASTPGPIRSRRPSAHTSSTPAGSGVVVASWTRAKVAPDTAARARRCAVPCAFSVKRRRHA